MNIKINTSKMIIVRKLKKIYFIDIDILFNIIFIVLFKGYCRPIEMKKIPWRRRGALQFIIKC